MFFRFFRRLGWLIGHILYTFEVTGIENVPKEGAFLLCSNHIHAFDPVALAIFMKRDMHFMAKAELFRNRVLRFFMRGWNAYPVNREITDLEAFRTTIKLLKGGQPVLIFSQGTRMKEFENAKSGVAVFAIKTGTPIVPVGISGSYAFRTKIRINFGAPIPVDKYEGKKANPENIDELMQIVVEKVTALTA